MFSRTKTYKSLVLVTVFILVLSLAGCSSTTKEVSSDNSSKQEQNYNLKFGHILSKDSAVNAGAEKFAEVASQKSNGKLQIIVHPGGELGNEREMLEQITLGTLDMGAIAAGQIANYQAEAGIFNLPYIFRDYDHVYKVLDGDVGKEVSSIIADKQKLETLGYFTQSFRIMLTTKKEIKELPDFNGLKLRTPEAPVFVQTFSTLGANPTPVPFTEAYTALQTNVVEGIESPSETLYLGNMHEVTKYLHKTNHLFEPMLLVINKDVYDELPSEIKEALAVAAQEAVPFERQLVEQRDKENTDKLIAGGLKEVPINVDSLRDAVKPLYEEYKGKISNSKLVDDIIATN